MEHLRIAGESDAGRNDPDGGANNRHVVQTDAALAQHELHVLSLPATGQLQGSHAVGADRVDGGASQQQGRNDPLLVAFDRVHQRRPPPRVAGVHVGTRLQEHVHRGVIRRAGPPRLSPGCRRNAVGRRPHRVRGEDAAPPGRRIASPP
ncbi:hypothetical protein OHB44_13510 [Micromonospora sp. NBC_00821]|nr:hypothetical protein OHB44_13510 [Micromonospora sp. NBC_00821]